MKKKILSCRILPQFLLSCLSYSDQYSNRNPYIKVKLSFLFSFVCFSLWAQPPHTFNVNGTLVVPAGITTMDVQAWGGGGAGGGASGSALLEGRSAGGGGGGAYTRSNITVVASNTLNIVVAGQTAGTAINGISGGNSTITGYEAVILAAGGAGGLGNTSGGAPAGGSGGLASNSFGTTKTSGEVGGSGGNVLAAVFLSSGKGGNGASPGGGTGGAAFTSVLLGSSAGSNGNAPGGGGSGAMNSALAAPQIGGAGAAGRIIVTYTCPTYGISGTSALNACTSLGNSLVTFTSTAALLPIGTYTVTYNRSVPAGTGTATMIVASAGTGQFTATGLTTAGSSTITVTNLKSGVCSTNISSSNVATITVSAPSVGGAVTGGTTICNGQTSAVLTVAGHTGSVIKWQSSTDSFNTATDIANTATTYTSGALTQTTQFRAVIQSGVCTAANSTATTVTVNALPQGSLTANGPFCATGSGQLTFTATAGTGPYTIIYKENGGADRTALNVVSGTPFNTFTTPVTSTTTYTLVSVTGANTCIRNSGFTGGSATITVNPLPQGSLTANGPFCATGSGQLTFTATAGTGPYTVIYKENGGADLTALNVASGTPFNTFTTPVTSTTTYTLVSVTGANTCIRSSGFTSGSATITVNPLPQGSLTANGPFCATGSGQLTFTATAGTGPYTVIYKENGGADRTALNVVSGTPFNTFTTPVTSTTTYTLVSVTGANTCIRSSGFTSGSATITVNPIPTPTFTVQPGASVCVSTDVTYTTQAGESNYIWSVPGIVGTDYTITSGGISATSNTVTLQWLTIGNKAVTVSYTSIGCAAGTSASNTTNITKTIKGVVNGGTHICSGDSSPLLTLNSYSGAIVRWEYAEAIPYVWQPISNTANTYQPGILTTSTSYRAVVKDGTCAEDFAIETRIDIDPKPSIPIVGLITQPTCVTPTGSIALSGLLASPNWTITQNGTTTYTSTGTNYTITNLVPGNYTFTIHSISSCPSLSTINIEIKAPVTNIWNGTNWSKGSSPIITDVIRFSGNYITTGDLSGCSCIIDPGANVTVSSNNTMTIVNPVTNNGGQLTFENNSSLVQINNNPAINSGNITYKRTSKQILRGDFVYWSTPVNPQKLIDVSPGTLYNKYMDFNGDYWREIDRNNNMIIGKGYIIRGPENYSITARADYTALFTGVPNNGNISGETLQSGKYYLIGNPYPSALDSDMLLSANLFLDGTIYFWTHNTPVSLVGAYQYTTDDYATYNTTGGVAVSAKSDPGHTDNPATDAGVKPTGKVGAGQSFFAKALNNGTVSFTNDMRLGGANNSQFFKTTNSSKTADDLERHRVWLNLSNVQGAFKQLLVGYIEGATNDHDNRFDGETMDANPYLDFYSINSGNKYVIQGRALPFSDTDLVPLGYRSALVSDFTISIDQVDGNLINQDIYIEDKVTGLTQNLKTSSYTFSSTIGTFDNRFVLRYTNNTLGTDDFKPTDREVLITVKNKIITINAFDNFIDEILIYDITGKAIYRKNNLNDTEFQIENLKSQNQVLLVKVRLENDNVTTQKIAF